MIDTPIYLDHAATTPVLPEVRDAMLPFLDAAAFGNPSSAHQLGRAARAAVDEARQQVAKAVRTGPAHVVFTAGGTEADNLAVLGRALQNRVDGGPFRVAVAATEHKAVLGAAHAVESLGGEMIELPVHSHGRLRLEALDEALNRDVAIVSVMWVNNETGVVQDIPVIATRCHAAGVLFHTDAVQALGKLPMDLSTLPDVLVSVSAHKIGGPKGTGALIVPDPSTIMPLIHGGGQQSGMRPGTENVAGITGLGRAAELAAAHIEEHIAARGALRDAFEQRLLDAIPDATVHAAETARAPHISNVGIPGTDSEAMLMHLDLAGICCSAGSACTTGAIEPSHVLHAMGVPDDLAIGSLRFSFGEGNTMEDVNRAIEILPAIVAKVRKLGKVLGHR